MLTKEESKTVGVCMKVYRNEPTMHKAIQSVLNQTYKNLNYYILVNDLTAKIIEGYARKDNRIKVIYGRPADTFLVLLEYAATEKNDYITAIDADDWYDELYIENLVSIAEEQGTDILSCGNYFVDGAEKIVAERKQRQMVWNAVDTGEVLPYMYDHFRTIWGKLISARVIAECDFNCLPEFKQYGGYGGDTMIMFAMFPYARKIGLSGKTLYFYRMSESGASQKLTVGRLNADQIVFEFVEEILSKLNSVNNIQRCFLLRVYGNAVFDTLKVLLQVKISEHERTEKVTYIFQKQLTKELLLKESKGALEFPGLMKCSDCAIRIYHMLFLREEQNKYKKEYLQILEILFPNIQGIIIPEEFGILIKSKQLLNAFILEEYKKLTEMLLTIFRALNVSDKEFCLTLMKKISTSALMKNVLQSSSFVGTYVELLKLLNKECYADARETLRNLFSENALPQDAENLIDLWINLAALEENAEEFILAKQIKVEILIETGETQDALSEFKELAELGVNDENMEYLKCKIGL